MKTSFLAILLAACGGATPPSATIPPNSATPAAQRPDDGHDLSADAWRAFSDEPGAPQPPDTCGKAAATKAGVECGDGHWLVALVSSSMGQDRVKRVRETAHGFTIYVDGNHPCGAPRMAPHWRVWLPDPIRPVEEHDDTPGAPCRGQP